MVTFLVVVLVLEAHIWNIQVENFIAQGIVLLYASGASSMAYQIDKIGVFEILAL